MVIRTVVALTVLQLDAVVAVDDVQEAAEAMSAMEEMVDHAWLHTIKKLPGATRAYPQSAYSALQALRTTRMAVSTTHNPWFDLPEKAIQEESIRALFGEAIDDGRFPARACIPFSETLWTGSTKHTQFRKTESPSK